MSGKSHRKGMADASKVYGDKFEKVGDDLKQFEKEHIKKHEEENERQKDINDHFEKKIDNLEKGRIYKDNTLYDIKEVLNESEQEYLMAYLVTLANELDANEEQQEFIRALSQYLGVQVHSVCDDFTRVSELDVKGTRAFLQTIMEYLFLEQEDFDFLDEYEEELFEDYNLNRKGFKQIKEHITRIYNAMGIEGIVEKYGFVAEEDEEEEQDKSIPYYDGMDISRECAVEMFNDFDKYDQGKIEYIELDDYLVYLLNGGRIGHRESRLVRVSKETGSKQELDVRDYLDIYSENNSYGAWERIGENICGYGKYVFFVPYNYSETNYLYQMCVESGDVKKCYLHGHGHLEHLSRMQVNDKYVLYIVNCKPYLYCIESENTIDLNRLDSSMFGYFGDIFLVGDYIFTNNGYCSYRYNIITSEKVLVDQMQVGDYEKKDFLGPDNTKYGNGMVHSLYRYLNHSTGEEFQGLTFVDVEEPRSIQSIKLPRNEKCEQTFWMHGCGKIYYLTLNEEEDLCSFDFITKENKEIGRKMRIVPYTIEEKGIFKTIREYEYREPKAYVIGRWLVYKKVQKSWSDNYFENVGDLCVIDLEGAF